MKNNRALNLSDTSIDINKLPTTSPPHDSLFWTLWNACEEIAQEALNTDFVQGIKSGTLNPQTYGAFNVSDAYYCFHGAADYQTAADNATHPVLKAYLQQKHDSYQSYNETFPDTWRVQDGSSIVPTQVCKEYSEFETSVCQSEEPIYALIVMLPCEYLWAWLGEQLAGYEENNLYKDWITGNQGFSGAYKMGNFINEYVQENPIDHERALSIYRQAMTFEKDNFATI